MSGNPLKYCIYQRIFMFLKNSCRYEWDQFWIHKLGKRTKHKSVCKRVCLSRSIHSLKTQCIRSKLLNSFYNKSFLIVSTRVRMVHQHFYMIKIKIRYICYSKGAFMMQLCVPGDMGLAFCLAGFSIFLKVFLVHSYSVQWHLKHIGDYFKKACI